VGKKGVFGKDAIARCSYKKEAKKKGNKKITGAIHTKHTCHTKKEIKKERKKDRHTRLDMPHTNSVTVAPLEEKKSKST